MNMKILKGETGGWSNYLESNATLWLILQVKDFQIFSWAEILRWAECDNKDECFSSEINQREFFVHLRQAMSLYYDLIY